MVAFIECVVSQKISLNPELLIILKKSEKRFVIMLKHRLITFLLIIK